MMVIRRQKMIILPTPYLSKNLHDPAHKYKLGYQLYHPDDPVRMESTGEAEEKREWMRGGGSQGGDRHRMISCA